MTPTRLGYRPALDGVRAVAILIVLGMHAFGWPRQGGLGVDLFFVLSGFLITALLLEERTSNGRIDLRAFYRRRLLRLFPALCAMLVAYLVVSWAVGDLADVIGPVALAASYTSNLALAHDVSAMPTAIRHLWSLAQEEQFYLLWPPLFALTLRYRPLSAKPLLMAMIGVVAFERAALAIAGSSLNRFYFAPDTHAEPILIGCLFGLWYATGLPELLANVRTRQALAAAALPLFLIATVVLHPIWGVLYVTPLLTLIAAMAGVIVLSAALDDRGAARLLRLASLVYVGRISYSVYLWHVPLLAAFGATALGHGFLRSLLVAAAAVVVGAFSHRVIEQPFLRLRRRPVPRPVDEPTATPALARI